MGDVNVSLRIRVITVSTRAALRSLPAADPQAAEILARAHVLLDELERTTDAADSKQAFGDARAELDTLRPG